MNASSRTRDAGLLEIFRFFIRHFWMIFGISFLFGVLAYGASKLMTPIYRSEIKLVPVEQSGGGAISSLLSSFGGLGGLGGLGNSRNSQKNEALAMLRSRAFVAVFIADNNGFAVMYPDAWDAEAGAWNASVESAPSDQDAYVRFTNAIMGVSEQTDAGTITIAITLKDRFVAAQWANEIVRSLNDKFRNRISAEAQGSIDYLNAELDKASSVGLRQAINRLIEAQIQTIMLTNVRKEYIFRVIDPAVVQDSNRFISPRRALLAFVGLVFGGFLGLFVSALRDALRAGSRARVAVKD